MRWGRGTWGRPAIAGLLVAGALLAGCTGEQRVQSLKAGDCFDDTVELLELGEVTTVPSVACDQPHDNEVYHVARYSGDSYSVPRIEDFAMNVCYGAFEPYVGRTYETSVLEIGWLIPTQDSWSRGDREVTCVLFHMDFAKLRRSARGSGL